MNVFEFITFRVFGFARHLHYRGIRIRRNPDTMFPLEVPDSKVSGFMTKPESFDSGFTFCV